MYGGLTASEPPETIIFEFYVHLHMVRGLMTSRIPVAHCAEHVPLPKSISAVIQRFWRYGHPPLSPIWVIIQASWAGLMSIWPSLPPRSAASRQDAAHAYTP
jgi:hypothetical protein